VNIFKNIILLVIACNICSTTFAQEEGALPNFYSEPGIGGNGKRQSLSTAPNESIDPFSGALSLVHTDLVLPGNGGLDIVVQRSYSPNNAYFTLPMVLVGACILDACVYIVI